MTEAGSRCPRDTTGWVWYAPMSGVVVVGRGSPRWSVLALDAVTPAPMAGLLVSSGKTGVAPPSEVRAPSNGLSGV